MGLQIQRLDLENVLHNDKQLLGITFVQAWVERG